MSHVDWEGEQNTLYKGMGTPKGKAQRGQHMLAALVSEPNKIKIKKNNNKIEKGWVCVGIGLDLSIPSRDAK